MEVVNLPGKSSTVSKDYKKGGGLFIPGGTLLGLGFGFLIHNVPAGMFIGLGLGFVVFAIILLKNRG